MKCRRVVFDPFTEWQWELPLRPPFSFSDDFDCLTCGACCIEAGYVAVYPDEVIPAQTKPLRKRHENLYSQTGMRELERHCEGRCKCLVGVVGKKVSCGIYENRPRTCQKFERGSDACKAARQSADDCIHAKIWERRGYGNSWSEQCLGMKK